MITILQEPQYPNVTHNNLMYALSSSNADKPQYRYIVDVYDSGSANLLTRMKLYPNENFVGITDLAPILNDYLEYDDLWKAGYVIFNTSSYKDFDIKVGEQYATSSYIEPTIYPDLLNTTASVFAGVVENDSPIDYLDYETSALRWRLSNFPANQYGDYYYLRPTDYQTISFIEDGFQKYADMVIYNDLDVLYSGNIWAQATVPKNRMVVFGIGPQNLIDSAAPFTSVLNGEWTSYQISFRYASSRPKVYTVVNTQNCYYDTTRFAFINKYGVWDYYSVSLPVSKDTRIERKTYTDTFRKYSGVTSPKVLSNRGKTQYNLTPTDKYKITTEYLNQAESDWLTEMYDSPSVYVQVGSEFIPINITSAGYTWKTNPLSQKIFQHDIEWEYSNARRSRT